MRRKTQPAKIAGLVLVIVVTAVLGLSGCQPASPPSGGSAAGGQGGTPGGGQTPGGSGPSGGTPPSLPSAETPPATGLYAHDAYRLAAEAAHAVDAGAEVVEVAAGAVETAGSSGGRSSVAPHGWSDQWSFFFSHPAAGKPLEFTRFLVVVAGGKATAGKVRTDGLAFVPNEIDPAAIDSRMVVYLADEAGGSRVRTEWAGRPGFCVRVQMTCEYGRPLWLVIYEGKNAEGRYETKRFVVDRGSSRAWSREERGLAERPGLTATQAYAAAKGLLDYWLGSGIASYELVEYVGQVGTARAPQLLRGEFDPWTLRFRVKLVGGKTSYVKFDTLGAMLHTYANATGSDSSAPIPPGEVIDSARAVALLEAAGGKSWREATPDSIYRISSGILGYKREVDVRIANAANPSKYKRIQVDPVTMKQL